MNCKFCGNEIKGDAEFCPECGKNLKEETIAVVVEEKPKNVEEKAKKKKFKKDKISVVIGTIIIIIGILRLLDSSVSIDSASFGADFYTYTYKGIVACAEILGKINATLSWCLIAFGSYIDIKAIKEKN